MITYLHRYSLQIYTVHYCDNKTFVTLQNRYTIAQNIHGIPITDTNKIVTVLILIRVKIFAIKRIWLKFQQILSFFIYQNI